MQIYEHLFGSRQNLRRTNWAVGGLTLWAVAHYQTWLALEDEVRLLPVALAFPTRDFGADMLQNVLYCWH